jgi:hypothetical protein
MTAHLIKFPRQFITITSAEDGWLVLTPRGHGWLHGSRRSANADARWLSKNLGLAVFETTTTTS